MATSGATRPRLRPLSVGEILDVSIKVCIAHWRTLLPAVLVVVVPVQIVSTALTADYTVSSLDFGTSSTQTAQESFDEFSQFLGGLVISTVLQGLAVLLATATCFRAIARAYLGEATDWRSSLSYALRRAPALLWLTLLYVLGLGLATLALLLPAVWLFVAWAFALPALLVEGLRGRAALGRSFRLVKGRWWRTFAVVAVGFVLAAIVSGIVQAVFVAAVLAGSDNDLLTLVLDAAGGVAGLAIGTPFQAALLTVVYFDLRVRKEAFDLELLAREIGGGSPATASDPPRAPVPRLLPPDEEIDRTGAPFWPPPPGWKPPGADGGEPPPRLPGVPSE